MSLHALIKDGVVVNQIVVADDEGGQEFLSIIKKYYDDIIQYDQLPLDKHPKINGTYNGKDFTDPIIIPKGDTSGDAILSKGNILVETIEVTLDSKIILTPRSKSPSAGNLYYGGIIDKTSFIIKSDNPADDREVSWVIIK